MVEYTYNDYGYVSSFCEWTLMNDGEYIYIGTLWIHAKLKREQIIEDYIQKIGALNPQSKWVYWTNKKHNERMILCEIVRKNGKIELVKRRIADGK